MGNWRTFLDQDTLARVVSLGLIGCQFTWREEFIYGAPTPIWFEIWRHGRLLNVAGPFPQPVGLEVLSRVKELILQQDRLLTFRLEY